MKIKIAMLQIHVEPDEVDINLHHALEMIKRAKKYGCNLVVLPECFDIGWANTRAGELAEPIPGKTSGFLCRAANEHQLFVVAGITEKRGEKIYNSAVIIDDNGNLLGKHSKIKLLKDIETIYSAGDSLRAYDTPIGKIAINICADLSKSSLFLGQSVALMGAQLIVSPCSWAVPPDASGEYTYGKEWLESYSSLAKEYGTTIISVSNVGIIKDGVWKDWKCIGNSIAMGSNGVPIKILPYGENAEEMHIVEYEIT